VAAKPANKSDRTEHATSVGDVASHFGVNRRTIFEWKKRGMPVANDGYDLAAIAVWVDAEFKRSQVAGDDAERAALQKRLLQQQVERGDLDLAAAKHDLAKPSDLARKMETAIGEIKAHMGEFPGRFAAALPETFSDDLKRLAQQIAHEQLDRVYQTLTDLAEGRIE